MVEPPQTIRILVVRRWTEPLGPLRVALREAGYAARLYVVDIEPALNAALERGGFEIVLHDESTPGIPRDLLDARMREHRRAMPIVPFTSVEAVVEGIRAARLELMN